MKEEAKPVKGIRISRMNAAIITISLFLYVLLSVTAFRVSGTIQDSYRAMEEFFTCTQIGKYFYGGSNYLTEQARLFVSTGDAEYVENYFTEVHTTRRRENALELLAGSDLNADITEHLNAAMEKSEVLMKREIYAMALIFLSQGSEVSSLEPELQNAPLTEEDYTLSLDQLNAKAREQVFGSEYQAVREKLSNDVDDLIYALGGRYGKYMESKYEELHRAMVTHQTLIVVHFAATFISFAFTLFLVSLPLGRFVKRVKDGNTLRLSGAYECRRLAQTYNTMLTRIRANENTLRHQAEHDALTGLLNRGAFEALQNSLENCLRPLALLLVDVDKFKQVNDGYGHETGDKILKKVAGLLSDYFRSTDYPIRIGGDEFAVIVMDAVGEEQDTIMSKITAINEILTHPDDGLPVVSLSVGGAFSNAGFTKDLYRNADAALYEVKEQGRCGCRLQALALNSGEAAE